MSSNWIAPMKKQLPGERVINQPWECSLKRFLRKSAVLGNKRSQHELRHPSGQWCLGKSPELFLERSSLNTSTLTTFPFHGGHHFLRLTASGRGVLKDSHPVGIMNVLGGWAERKACVGPSWQVLRTEAATVGWARESLYYFCLFLNERRWFKNSGGQERFPFSYP